MNAKPKKTNVEAKAKYDPYKEYLSKSKDFYQKAVFKASTNLILTLMVISIFAFFAIRPTLVTITKLNKELEESKMVNRKLEIAGILVSLFKSRRSIEQLYAEVLAEKGLPLFETKIKDSSKYREAIANRKPITHYKPRSEHADAFRVLRDELEKVYVT